MSFTYRVVLPLAGVAAALSMLTISLAAETAPPTPPAHATLPAACQLPATNATPTAKVADEDRENDNDEDGEMSSSRREAIRACIEALRAEGKHDLREIVALIARARAERNNHGHEQDDDTAPTATDTATATATATPTGTATPERRGGHTPPTHHRD
jgi:hypothetical protein